MTTDHRPTSAKNSGSQREIYLGCPFSSRLRDSGLPCVSHGGGKSDEIMVSLRLLWSRRVYKQVLLGLTCSNCAEYDPGMSANGR
jgi:hypothetical protein